MGYAMLQSGWYALISSITLCLRYFMWGSHVQWRYLGAVKKLKTVLDRIISTILFYLGWILSLKEASEGNPFYGLLVAVFIVAYHLYKSTHRKADGFLIFLVILLGPISDIVYAKVGLLHYNSQEIPWLPPFWIFFLWGLFAANVHLFTWMKKHWFLSVTFGAIGAPVSYLSAIRLGGADLLLPFPYLFLIIGGLWAFLLPAVIWLSDKLREKMHNKNESGARSQESGD